MERFETRQRVHSRSSVPSLSPRAQARRASGHGAEEVRLRTASVQGFPPHAPMPNGTITRNAASPTLPMPSPPVESCPKAPLIPRQRPPAESRPKAPLRRGKLSPMRAVPPHIPRPPYADSGISPPFTMEPQVHGEEGQRRMREAGQLAARVRDHAGTLVKPGVTTDEIDRAVHEMIIEAGAYPSPLNYAGFPKSVCTSVNECICHGIPDSRPLEDGDIINIDVTVYLNGYHGDTSKTFYCGNVSNAAKKLVEVTEEALNAAIAICGPDAEFKKIGHAIHAMADKHSYGVVRKFIGHGVGSVFHAGPAVLHYRESALHLSPTLTAPCPHPGLHTTVFHAGPAVLHYREIAPPAPSSPPLSLFSLSHPHPHLFIGHGVGSVFHAGPAVLHYREFSPLTLLSPPPATNLPGTLPYSPPLKPLTHLFIGHGGPPWPHSSHQSPSQPPSFTSTGIGLTPVLHSPDKSCSPLPAPTLSPTSLSPSHPTLFSLSDPLYASLLQVLLLHSFALLSSFFLSACPLSASLAFTSLLHPFLLHPSLLHPSLLHPSLLHPSLLCPSPLRRSPLHHQATTRQGACKWGRHSPSSPCSRWGGCGM
ncbi:unnamed protein product [Closterium sp. Naga37s-1]|nr:unnamed protein product [Closterium sp. Naga37s-1]